MPKIPIEEISEETRKKLGLEIAPTVDEVGAKLIVLGRVFKALKGLSESESLWVLEKAQLYIQKYAGRQDADMMEVVIERSPDYVPPTGWVLQVVAKAFDVMPADLVLRKRDSNTALARQVAMYLLWKTEKYSLTEVGKALGGRCAATVSHGFQHIAHLLTIDNTLESKVSEIISLL